MNPVFAKQLRTYLVLSGLEIGLVVNFGMALMKDGIVRVINSHNLNDSPTRLCGSASLREKEKDFPQRHRDTEKREELDVKEDDVRQITGDIIDSAMKIHKMFGPGMLESDYERILAIELKRRGHVVECQKAIGFTYEDEAFEDAFRLDLLVDEEVVVELKSTGTMNPVFAKQLRTYLVLSGLEIGLVVNFGMALMKDGIVRVINSHNLNDSPTRLCASAGKRKKVSHRGTETQRKERDNTLCLTSLRETNKGVM